MRISANVHPIHVGTRRVGSHPTECRGNDNASEDSLAGLSRLIESCSSCLTLQRRVAWIVRFCQWVADKRIARSTGPLTLEDLSQSTQVIVRCVQNKIFPEDVKEVKLNKEVKKSSKLGNLRPVLVDGVLRVGGRLQKAVVLSWDEKHPMVLPKRHPVGQLIVRH